MKEDIKLSKFDNRPWGFRLIGGQDFPTPLTVVKDCRWMDSHHLACQIQDCWLSTPNEQSYLVNPGSVADEAGLRVGDVLLSINDQPLYDLTHWEAHEAVKQAGNNFLLSITRDSHPMDQPIKNLSVLTLRVTPTCGAEPTELQHNIVEMQEYQYEVFPQIPEQLSLEEQFQMLCNEELCKTNNTFQQVSGNLGQEILTYSSQQEIPVHDVPDNFYSQNIEQWSEYDHQFENHKLQDERNLTEQKQYKFQQLQQEWSQQQQQQQFENEQQRWLQLQQVGIQLKQKQQLDHQQQYKEDTSNLSVNPQPHLQSLLNAHHGSIPEEIYSEEYIAEVMSGNAEVIIGNTIGVNFHKFKKDPDNLKYSSVLQFLKEEESKKGAAK